MSAADPYHWLEDASAPRTVAWVDGQNTRTRAFLDGLEDRDAWRDRLLALLREPASGGPVVVGDRVFHLRHEGAQDQAVLVVRSAADRDEPPRVVVDPHTAAADHAASIDWFSPSPDGRLVAYGISQGGAERSMLRITGVDSGDVLDDAIDRVRHPSLSWLPDASAFVYSRLPDPATVEPGEDGYWESLLWHRVGDDPVDDRPVLSRSLERTALPWASVSADGRWVTVHIHLMPSRTDVVLVDLSTGAETVVVEGEEASTTVQVVGGRLYGMTNLGSPRGRVVSAAVDSPMVGSWTTVVPESEATVEGVVVAGESLLVASTQHAVSRLHRYALDGSDAAEVDLGGAVSIGSFDADPAFERAFLTVTSFDRPASMFRWTPATGIEPWETRPARRAAGPAAAPADLVVEQVFYSSTGGATVPMFVVRAPSTEPSPDTPTVLSAYGGFAISSSPGFSPGVVSWCEAGGVYALAGIRGGAEYGEDWHRAGMLDKKQNCFDDFFAAAEWLVAGGRTSAERLGIRGGSNGGLLVGATITQRPDLCRAAVCAVPLADMLRYHLFLIGALWVPEYGDPDDPDQRRVLAAYSPYHRVVDGTRYPAVLVTTAESDARVDPMHALKLAARLQEATSSPPAESPVLLRLERRAGHGIGKPVWKQADEAADAWSFLAHFLGAGAPGQPRPAPPSELGPIKNP